VGCGGVVMTMRLSRIEVERLQAYADGETGAGLARTIGVSEQVIKNQRRRILDKLGADSMPHAVALAMRRGIIQ
jgi:DNA-binding NarL/FixJ family response regulator